MVYLKKGKKEEERMRMELVRAVKCYISNDFEQAGGKASKIIEAKKGGQSIEENIILPACWIYSKVLEKNGQLESAKAILLFALKRKKDFVPDEELILQSIDQIVARLIKGESQEATRCVNEMCENTKIFDMEGDFFGLYLHLIRLVKSIMYAGY